MKTSTAQPFVTSPITDAFKRLLSLKSETALLNQRLADAQARLASLTMEGDLDKEAVLSEIGRLQTLTTLLPNRITAREVQHTQAEDDVFNACHQFIGSALWPLLTSLRLRTEIKVGNSLRNHLSGRALEIALNQSEQMHEIAGFEHVATIRLKNSPDIAFGGREPAEAYVESLVQCWEKMQALDADLPALTAAERADYESKAALAAIGQGQENATEAARRAAHKPAPVAA